MVTLEQIDEAKQQFRDHFNFKVNIPDELIESAAVDPLLAHHLQMIDGNDDMLQLLTGSKTNSADLTDKTSKELVFSGLKTLIKWGNSGFKSISEGQFQKRWKTCQACPNLKDPGNQFVYGAAKRILKPGSDQRVCGLCGCIAQQKAKIITENCPDESLTKPGYSRWNEIMQ